MIRIRYELVNPSDTIFLQAEDLRTAILCAIYVGEGAYGLKTVDDTVVMPLFLFGGADEYLIEKFGSLEKVREYALERPAELVACLRSFKLKGTRTSTNNICGRAHAMADQFRKAANLVEAKS